MQEAGAVNAPASSLDDGHAGPVEGWGGEASRVPLLSLYRASQGRTGSLLRQLACHPSLHDPSWEGPASKLERLLELVDELREEGHRALIFSQFTRHLGLVRKAL